MTLHLGFPFRAGSQDDWQRSAAGMVVRDVNNAPRPGVLPHTAANIVTARSDMKVNVLAFNAVLTRTAQGVVFINNDGTVVVDVTTAPGSNSRIDVVWVKQNDSISPNADANSNPVFGVTAGTSGASPAKPAIPDGALELATILIPSTATATNSGGVTITQTYQRTAMAGGIVDIRNSTDQAAFSAAPGQVIRRVDLDLYRERVTGPSSTLVWAPFGEASWVQDADAINPIPTSATTIPNSSKTFTLTALSTRCEIDFWGLVQLNQAMTVDLDLQIDGVSVQSSRAERAAGVGEHRYTIRDVYIADLANGSHTVRLQVTASVGSNSVIYNPAWRIILKRPADPFAA